MTNQMLGCVILGSLMLGVEKGGGGSGRYFVLNGMVIALAAK